MTEFDELIESDLFAEVREYIDDTLLIAWDQCHKIYCAIDHYEAKKFRKTYQCTFEGTKQEMLVTLAKWWTFSCPLRFIQAVTYCEENPNLGYINLIPQFADQDDDDEALNDLDI